MSNDFLPNDVSSNDTSSTSAVSDLSEEAEALLQLSHQESDEGIVSDQSSSADPDDATKRIKVGLFHRSLYLLTVE